MLEIYMQKMSFTVVHETLMSFNNCQLGLRIDPACPSNMSEI